MSFKLINIAGKNRQGVLQLPHGVVHTPFFMPIATKGAVKTLSSHDVDLLGAEIILSNTYHQFLRPGVDLIKKAGGLHKFIDWKKPILTDSGGFQIFSLGKRGDVSRRDKACLVPTVRDERATTIAPPHVTEEGVEFQSPLDGAKHFITPEDAVQIQLDLGSDIIMVLDHLVGYPATYEESKEAMERSVRWEERAREYFQKVRGTGDGGRDVALPRPSSLVPRPLLFAIIQGGVYDDLRVECVKKITAMNFDGYAIGGLAVGEPEEEMYRVLDLVCPLLPEDKPRYLMGVGYPHQIVSAVSRGVDMFDCVIPTREARHGRMWRTGGELRIKNYELRREDSLYLEKLKEDRINILNEKFREDFTSINSASRFPELREYTLAYLRHLFISGEALGQRLATLNNLEFYLEMMRGMRR